MRPRMVLGVVLVCAAASTARGGILNEIMRQTGLGWSDGYHERPCYKPATPPASPPQVRSSDLSPSPWALPRRRTQRVVPVHLPPGHGAQTFDGAPEFTEGEVIVDESGQIVTEGPMTGRPPMLQGAQPRTFPSAGPRLPAGQPTPAGPRPSPAGPPLGSLPSPTRPMPSAGGLNPPQLPAPPLPTPSGAPQPGPLQETRRIDSPPSANPTVFRPTVPRLFGPAR